MTHPISNASSAHPVRPSRENPFSALGLHRRLARVVEQSGYRNPTPIQSEAIPHVLDGRDVLGCAQTGTGKTAAFALPILDHLVSTAGSERRRPVRALVLAPTRELAAQIADSFRRYGRGERLRTEVVFGGVGKRPQVQALRAGADVLVATPGRLLDLLDDRAVDLRQVEVFVLDEADRMLDMGFIHDVKRIAGTLPDERQTLLFSATMPNEIRTLADRLLADPVRVAVDPVSSTRAPIAQSVYFVERRRKAHLLLDLLKDGEIERALVFTRTKHGANRLAQKLDRARVSAAAIHGDKSQGARERALADFKRGRTRVVVATDVAARGIDVKDLSHVINFDLPEDPESYVHRVGRTGRAGRSGVAFSFCSGEERAYLDSIERLTKRKVERRATPEGFDAGDVHAVAARAARGRGSRRPRDAQETGLRRKTSHRRTSNRAEGGRRRR